MGAWLVTCFPTCFPRDSTFRTQGKLAEHAEFFSFGTNDLTQTTYGLSRDDTGTFMADYKAGVYSSDVGPF